MGPVRSTTILSVRRGGRVALGGDGQVTVGDTVFKTDAIKVRRLAEGRVLTGFAGSAADAFTLLERFEGMLKKYTTMPRAAIELAKLWRTDKVLRRLESMLCACDAEVSLVIGGSGDVIEPPHGVMAIGSGAGYARAAALALMRSTDLSAADIVRRSLEIAGEICIYTNTTVVVEELEDTA